MARKKNNADKPQIVGLFGVGLDNQDGHQRVTRGEEFVVIGGSEATHEKMQDVVIHFEESLHERGKRLQDASEEEVMDLLFKAMDR